MCSRFCLVFLLQVCLLGSFCLAPEASVAHHRPHDYQNNAIPNHSLIEKEHKLLIECHHADYRAYIKCLKREKRQQTGLGNNQSSCFNECLDGNCTTSICMRECHSHCKKRLIETYTKTVETSFDCANGECTEAKLPGGGNFTAIVHINNNMPNVSKCNDTTTTGGGKDGETGTTSNTTGNTNVTGGGIVPKIDINNVINNQFGSGFGQGADCSYPGSNCYPLNPWQAMPQITIGIGGGPMGGCIFPSSWPCFQRYPQPAVDCSVCANPFLRYRCEPICNSDPRKNYTQPTTQRASTSNPWGNINGRKP